MSRNTSIPIVQVRTIGSLTVSKHGGSDWRSEALSQIADHIRTQPCEAPDHYEVKMDGLVLEVGLSEDVARAPSTGDVAWDDPDIDLNFPDQPTYPGD